MNSIKIGDHVFAQFPESALSLGGTVIMIISQQGKELEYCVEFSNNTHHTFPANLVKSS